MLHNELLLAIDSKTVSDDLSLELLKEDDSQGFRYSLRKISSQPQKLS